MSAPARSFQDAKAEGTGAEWLLLDLLRENGWIVTPHQVNWDAGCAPERTSAARAFMREPDSELHLPDLDSFSPVRAHVGWEVKSKVPRDKDGSFGWDLKSMWRAERWQERMNALVLYAIRDRSITPMPPNPARRTEGQFDDVNAWCFASLHRLHQVVPERITRRRETWEGDTELATTLYWPRETFTPLAELLEGRFRMATVLLTPPRSSFVLL